MIRISIGLNSLEFTIGKCGQKSFPFPFGEKKNNPTSELPERGDCRGGCGGGGGGGGGRVGGGGGGGADG